MTVCIALGLEVSKEMLLEFYTVIVNEMIVAKGLRRD
jgi:hypothetical protein